MLPSFQVYNHSVLRLLLLYSNNLRLRLRYAMICVLFTAIVSCGAMIAFGRPLQDLIIFAAFYSAVGLLLCQRSERRMRDIYRLTFAARANDAEGGGEQLPKLADVPRVSGNGNADADQLARKLDDLSTLTRLPRQPSPVLPAAASGQADPQPQEQHAQPSIQPVAAWQ